MKVAWMTAFPVEWLPDAPEPVRALPRLHPATWQRVLLEEFQARPDLDLHVLVPRRQFPRSLTFRAQGATFHCLKQPPLTHTLSLFWWETWLIRRRLREIRPDLVHAWGAERGAALVASRTGYPFLVTMHGLLSWIRRQVALPWAARLEAGLEPASLRRASLATVESQFGFAWLREQYPRLELRRVEHAPHRRFHRLERRPQTRPWQFLFVGVLSEVKGADLLLRGLDRLRPEVDFRLTVVGPAPDAFVRRMKAETSPGLWDRVTFRHGLSPQEVGEEMSRAALLLFPTRADNSPNSVKEAVVAGLPVVGSDVGGMPDHVVSGKNGITFPAGDLEAFIAAVRAALVHPLFGQGQVDPGTLQQMRARLSPEVMAEGFLAAYRRVLEKAA